MALRGIIPTDARMDGPKLHSAVEEKGETT